MDSEIEKLQKLINAGEITSNQYLIVLLSVQWTQKIDDYYQSNNFVVDVDVIFVKHKPIILEGIDCSKTPYVDHYGNQVFANLKNIRLTLYGLDSTIRIAPGNYNIKIEIYNEVKLTINKSVIQSSTIIGESQSTITIGRSYIESDSLIIAHIQCTVTIGDKCHILKNAIIVSHSQLVISDGCLISKYCVLQAGDGHTIFDLETKKPLENSKYKIKGIIIHEHVWIGIRVTVLDHTEIGIGSVIGAQSVVKGTFPNNCVIAGTPGKIIRKNISWSYNRSNNIQDCEGFTNFTVDTPD